MLSEVCIRHICILQALTRRRRNPQAESPVIPRIPQRRSGVRHRSTAHPPPPTQPSTGAVMAQDEDTPSRTGQVTFDDTHHGMPPPTNTVVAPTSGVPTRMETAPTRTATVPTPTDTMPTPTTVVQSQWDGMHTLLVHSGETVHGSLGQPSNASSLADACEKLDINMGKRHEDYCFNGSGSPVGLRTPRTSTPTRAKCLEATISLGKCKWHYTKE